MKLRNSEEKSDAMKRLHDDYRKQVKEAKTAGGALAQGHLKTMTDQRFKE